MAEMQSPLARLRSFTGWWFGPGASEISTSDEGHVHDVRAAFPTPPDKQCVALRREPCEFWVRNVIGLLTNGIDRKGAKGTGSKKLPQFIRVHGLFLPHAVYACKQTPHSGSTPCRDRLWRRALADLQRQALRV